MADSNRFKAREMVLKGLYALECGELEEKNILETTVTDKSLPESINKFAHDYFGMVKAYSSEADESISDLAENWKLERIAEIDRIIMRMAMTEIVKMPDIPVKVTINEALELAKKYSSEKSSGFINGILDNFQKSRAEKESGL